MRNKWDKHYPLILSAVSLIAAVAFEFPFIPCCLSDKAAKLINYSGSLIFEGACFSFLFFYFVEHRPQQRKTEHAFNSNKGTLTELLTHMRVLLSITNSLMNIDNDNIMYNKEKVYFRESTGEKSFAIIDEEILKEISLINKAIQKLVGNALFLQCNDKIISAIAELQSNQLIRILRNVISSGTEQLQNARFHGLSENKKEYYQLFSKLKVLCQYKFDVSIYTELSQEEKDNYIKLRNAIYQANKIEFDYDLSKGNKVLRDMMRIV